MLTFQERVSQELAEVRKRVKPFNSWHEAFAILLEEVEEFKEEVWKKSHKRNRDNALKELVQIAGIAQRAAEDLMLTSA